MMNFEYEPVPLASNADISLPINANINNFLETVPNIEISELEKKSLYLGAYASEFVQKAQHAESENDSRLYYLMASLCVGFAIEQLQKNSVKHSDYNTVKTFLAHLREDIDTKAGYDIIKH